jgi:mono/diheme cytochrome c family protein
MIGKVPSFTLVIGLAVGCTQTVTSPPTLSIDPGTAGSSSRGFTGGGAAGGFTVGGEPGVPFTEAAVVANPPPPPLSGGTLAVLSHGHLAAVSDPDRDQIVVVDLDQVKLLQQVSLQKGDEPGRLAEDGAGHVHVALRGAGAIVTLDPITGTLLERRSVCTHPRGVAYEAARDLIHVACVGGQLVSLPAAGGDPTRQLTLASDLRDVVVDGDHLLVSRFRSAELLVVDVDGRIATPLLPPRSTLAPATNRTPSGSVDGEPFAPAVAWRMIAAPGGGAIVTFQEEQTSSVQPVAGGYGSRCGSIVRTGVSMLRADRTSWTVLSLPTVLPVDVTITPSGSVEVISASTAPSDSVLGTTSPIVSFTPPPTDEPVDTGECSNFPGSNVNLNADNALGQFRGQLVAIGYDARGRRVVQTREPNLLVVGDQAVSLPGESRLDTGYEIFHLATSGGLACASCHPEGREDGHLWTFAGIGARRTQSIGGGILGTEPFHWNGDMHDFPTLAHEVLVNRMSGPVLATSHVEALAGWIDRIPPMKPDVVVDRASVDHGRALFQDPTVGCATCHAGSKLTNNQSVTVGTGGTFQVPSLVGVAWRAPYLHSGCAPTLEARFDECGGGELHGHTSQLGTTDRADLVAFLKSL